MNLAHFLIRSARNFPDRPAVTWRSRTITYREFNWRSAALASGLRTMGVERGSRVAIFLDNCPELLETLFAAFRMGAIVVPCNSRSTARELSFILSDSEASVLVTDERHLEIAAAATSAPSLCVGAQLEELIASNPGDEWSAEHMAPEDVAWIFYTSGTTGKPKGAMLSHAVLQFVTVSWLADLTPIDEFDVTLHAAPLSHGAGFHALAATARGASQVLLDQSSFDPDEVLRLMRSAKVTNTWLVPTQVIRLTERHDPALPLDSLRYVVYGGAPISPASLQRALDAFGPVLVQLYGQGETPMMTTVLRREEHQPEFLAAAGRERLGIELRIADENDESLPHGEIGEVIVRGPSVMSGYWRLPDETATTLRNGWLHTGDLGRMTEGGMLFLLDRSKDLIISGGANVYPVEVEAVLAAHPDVKEAAVIGVADELWGERVEAVVVMRDGRVLDPESLDGVCRSALADYKVPRRYHDSVSLPRNAYGKVVKADLRASIACRAKSSLPDRGAPE